MGPRRGVTSTCSRRRATRRSLAKAWALAFASPDFEDAVCAAAGAASACDSLVTRNLTGTPIHRSP
jgi:hypothetical protein